MSGLTQDGMAEPISRDQILRRERGQEKNSSSCSVDHEQGWQHYPVNVCMYGHTYSKSIMDQPGKVANPARGQLNRENEYFPVHVRA